MIRILLADDHPIFRYGLRAVLASDPDMELVGEAGSGEEAVELTRGLRPDVVLMDISMPGLNGVEATHRILQESPGTNILIVTMYDDSASVLAALKAGARGYVIKGADREELLRAVRAAAAGQTLLSPAAAQHLTGQITKARPAGQPFPELTAREHDILDLLAAGYTNPAIAERAGLSSKTVRNYISTILAKLGAASRAEAISRARAAGLGGTRS
ncbi:response regulator [Thermoactinospora rubra]|uniref:response regulator n=1 Tax=Thermoactinospora rubra TaxID=1088767 RepID=UPI0011811E43|nr:response regulator transcription factor [Thermoactinospora rubra]